MSNGQIMADRTPYMLMFLKKNTIWDYQKEWRLLGDANQKIKAPKINAIYKYLYKQKYHKAIHESQVDT